jgi:predicted component of type VI protein secretion system
MAIFEYGIGGNEVKVDASESIAAIPDNRTLIVEQLTYEEPVNPEVVTGLTNMEQVFAHYKPQMNITFENAEGQTTEETFRFSSVGDFSVKSMTAQSSFLNGLNTEKDFWENLQKQLRSNKVLQRALENPESRKAFLSSLEGLLAELKEADK